MCENVRCTLISFLIFYYRVFTTYRTKEKPPKAKEKVNVEASFFEIEIKLKDLKQAPFVPPEGQRLADIDQAWKILEKEEHLLETTLKQELMRQEKLEQLAAKFNQKIALRNSYLDEMIQVLSDPRYGANLSNVEASLKKHQAISADILSREDRFKEIESKMQYLEKENYHSKAAVRSAGDNVLTKWAELLELLNHHQVKLKTDNEMLSLLRDVDSVQASVKHLQESFNSEKFQKVVNIDESMQKLNLLESEINAISDSIRRLKTQAKQFLKAPSSSNPLTKSVEQKLEELEADYKHLIDLAKATRQRFEDVQCVHQIKNDLEEVAHWLSEKSALGSGAVLVKDLQALGVQVEKQKTLQTEFKKWHKKYENVQQSAKQFKLTDDPDFVGRVAVVSKQWEDLRALFDEKEKRLALLFSSLTLNSDLNDAESWLKDVYNLVTAIDVGLDEVTSNSLLNRHKDICRQIDAFEAKDMVKLKTGMEKMGKEVPAEKVERKIVQQRSVPQVRAMYSYKGHGVDVKKGELMFLLAKSNDDWWNVRTASGDDGFVPRNYVKEVEPKIVQVRWIHEYCNVCMRLFFISLIF